MTNGEFTYEWVIPGDSIASFGSAPSVSHPPQIGHPQITARETEIFVPSLLTRDRKVIVQGLDPLDTYLHDEGRQTLFILVHDPKPGQRRKVTVSLHPPLRPLFEVNDFGGDFGPQIIALFGLIFSLTLFWILYSINK